VFRFSQQIAALYLTEKQKNFLLEAKSSAQFGKDTMSKIGRKPIDIGNAVVEIKGSEVHFKGKRGAGVHVLPSYLEAKLENKKLFLVVRNGDKTHNNFWGLHRALLANELHGAEQGFEKQLQITGLGFKAAVSGSKLDLTLGYSHKITYMLPEGVTIDIDKTGQLLTVKSTDKEMVGHVCSRGNCT
jgi:large subunit ribosomal protein L6